MATLNQVMTPIYQVMTPINQVMTPSRSRHAPPKSSHAPPEWWQTPDPQDRYLRHDMEKSDESRKMACYFTHCLYLFAQLSLSSSTFVSSKSWSGERFADAWIIRYHRQVRTTFYLDISQISSVTFLSTDMPTTPFTWRVEADTRSFRLNGGTRDGEVCIVSSPYQLTFVHSWQKFLSASWIISSL